MAYREVTMVEVKEALRQWLLGAAKKTVAARLGLDPKTVRRYCEIATRHGVERAHGVAALTDDVVSAVHAELSATSGRPRGEAWATCATHRERIAEQLGAGVRLTKVQRLLRRDGVELPYATLHRYAVEELGFGRRRATVAVADGEPGHELQVDTAWLAERVVDERGRRRRLRVWIFTPSVSRYRFVYATVEETTASAIAACEAAWSFYGGVFRVLVPDNTKAIIERADATTPRVNVAFLEYAQARGFVVDPARKRRPTDKARVERSVTYVREDCFGGEKIIDVRGAQERALMWCTTEAGLRVHSRTDRRPRQHFEEVERAALLPAPVDAYDVPQWSEPKVAHDHYAQVQRALYSLPTRYIGKKLVARADRQTVRFYDRGELIKTHARQPRGGRSTDVTDFPDDRGLLASRRTEWLVERAGEYGEHVGLFAERLLRSPLPWTRMRRVYVLTDLGEKYGAERVDAACALALSLDMDDVWRLSRMLERGVTSVETRTSATPPPARFLRPAKQYALVAARVVGDDEGG